MKGPAFITGGGGFAGHHLIAHLREEHVECVAPTRQELDVREFDAVLEWISATKPAAVFHLAAHSSPMKAWSYPRETVLENIGLTHNLLEAVRIGAPAATVVIVGSAHSYGTPRELPVTEGAPLEPVSPYAVSKASGELLAHQYAAAFKMQIVCMRPFNHAGPGQTADYICGTLSQQIAKAEIQGARSCTLHTGSPDVRRDFTDVRDVVRAYVLAAQNELQGTYNVCSGVPTCIPELINFISQGTVLDITHEVDAGRIRAGEPPEIVGSYAKLRAACGWKPAISLQQTLADSLEWWRRQYSDA